MSLDIFRGLNIILMLVVNNIALDIYTPDQFGHAKWNEGMHIADLVFPWFLFCAGMSIPLAESAARAKGATERDLVRRIWRRGAVIFFWGLVLSSALEKRPCFTLGVLQLIAMAFVAGSFLMRLPERRRIQICAGLLIGYGLFASFFPFPGGPAFLEGNNAFKWLNSWVVLKTLRIQGITSVIPTAPLVVLGAMTTVWLRDASLDDGQRLKKLVTHGAALMLMGALWNFILPYNKPVWTPSYILMSGGLGVLCVAAFHYMVDLRGWAVEALRPTIFFGSNALLAYVFPILLKLLWFKAWTLPSPGGRDEMHAATLMWLKQWLGPIWGGSAYTAGYILFFWVLFAVFYQRKWFLKA